MFGEEPWHLLGHFRRVLCSPAFDLRERVGVDAFECLVGEQTSQLCTSIFDLHFRPMDHCHWLMTFDQRSLFQAINSPRVQNRFGELSSVESDRLAVVVPAIASGVLSIARAVALLVDAIQASHATIDDQVFAMLTVDRVHIDIGSPLIGGRRTVTTHDLPCLGVGLGVTTQQTVHRESVDVRFGERSGKFALVVDIEHLPVDRLFHATDQIAQRGHDKHSDHRIRSGELAVFVVANDRRWDAVELANLLSGKSSRL